MKNFISFLFNFIRGQLKKIFEWIKFYIVNIINFLDSHHAFLLAAGLTYNILLCIIPLVLIIFSVLGYVLDSQELIIQLSIIIDELIPITTYSDKIKEILFERVSEFVNYKAIVGAIGLVGVFFSASSLFSTLRTILNDVYGFEKSKHFLIAKLRDFGMVFITLLFFLITILINPLFQIFKGIMHSIPLLNNLNLEIFEGYFFQIIPIVITFVMMLAIYSLVPYRKMRKRIYVLSAIWATIFFEIAKRGFSFYVTNLANYSKIYGNIAFVVVTAFWLYIMSLIIIISAVIGEVFRRKKSL